ncbi:MAG: hypothetical protein M1827_006350 [Pycnora praestabilis]|nr:MAG: hypothetical protein M1827_006350 [Pycnora praestabilis]
MGNDRQENEGPVVVLPLNLIALIISYLYHNVSLHSYDTIRYVGGQPEGCGSASPFAMGLNGLVTRNVAGLVRSLRVWGEWKEACLEDHAKAGRVPDASMMLNMVVRAAVDKMDKLESFSWELNLKMLQTVYQGLAIRPALTSLNIKFPSSRLPRPTIIIPPMPHLRALKLTDIDPLCYPDDISYLLLHSKKLRDLKMHWSPRMRDELEPSISLHSYFGKCMAARYTLPLTSMAFHNLYAHNNLNMAEIMDTNTLRAVTFINSLGESGNDAETAFIDNSWRMQPPKKMPNLKIMRSDKLSKTMVESLARMSGLEKLYLVNAKRPSKGSTHATPQTARSPQSPTSSATPMTPASSATPSEMLASNLYKDYMEAIMTQHGKTLRHLLLSDQWTLGIDDCAKLIRSCPNLEQLGIGLDKGIMALLKVFIPFLPRLMAIRIFDNPSFTSWNATVSDASHEEDMGAALCGEEFRTIRWLGLGHKVFFAGKVVTEERTREEGEVEKVYRRIIKRVDREAVNDIAIWHMDSLEI